MQLTKSWCLYRVNNMRVIGLDYGDSRIGVALSDDLGWTAGPYGIIESKRGRKKSLNEIKAIIEQYGVETVVVGYPINMNGTKGPRTQVTEEFIEDLQKRNPDIKIVKWDERLTTAAADRAMLEMGIKQSVKGMNDKLAAVFILQGYLDSQR